MKPLKHAIIILVLVVISLSLAKSSSEVRDRAFVQSIEVIQNDDTICINVKTFGDDEGYIGIGSDIQACLDDAQLKQGKDMFTGHTEIVIFRDENFSLNVLESLVKERLISPNCPVILSLTEVTDSEGTLETLKSYAQLGRLKVLTASEIVKNLKLKDCTEIPILNGDLSYSMTDVNI